MRRSFAVLTSGLALLSSCRHSEPAPDPVVVSPPPAKPPPARPPPVEVAAIDQPGLRFVVAPDDAEVLIDGRSYGSANDIKGGVVELKPGIYQVSLKRPGYTTWRAEVTVGSSVEVIQVSMVKTP